MEKRQRQPVPDVVCGNATSRLQREGERERERALCFMCNGQLYHALFLHCALRPH